MKDFSLIKLNLLFELDENTNKKLEEFYKMLREKFGEIILERKDDGLPFHFTIIGGCSIYENDLKDFLLNHRGLLYDSLNKLKMFNKEKHIPKVNSFQLSWHAYPYENDRIIILRLKLGDYVLSGDREVNRYIAKSLGNEDMDFTLPSHVTICRFSIKKDSLIGFDVFFKETQMMFNGMNLKNIELHPSVFIKKLTDIKFIRLNVDF